MAAPKSSPFQHRFLSRGPWSVFLTSEGTGFSEWKGLRLTAWEGDPTTESDGWFLYLRDRDSGRFWSATPAPVPVPETFLASEVAEAEEGVARVERQVEGIVSRLEVRVAEEGNAEVRQLTLHNVGERLRRIEVTSHAPLVLYPAAAHAAHPGFARLFLETEWEPEWQAVLARRRPRARNESWPWLAMGLLGEGDLEFDTDRGHFLGRGGSVASPWALRQESPLPGAVGAVLDPAATLRRTVSLPPGASVTLTFVLAVASTRPELGKLLQRWQEPPALPELPGRAARAEREGRLRHRLASGEDRRLAEFLGALRRRLPGWRGDPARLRSATGETDLNGRFGVRPGRPLIVASLATARSIRLAEQLHAAQGFWRELGSEVDIVILLASRPEVVERWRRNLPSPEEPGAGVFRIERTVEVTSAEQADLAARAGAWIEGASSLARALSEGSSRSALPVRTKPLPLPPGQPAAASPSGEPLRFWNGIGGFSEDGREYVMPMREIGPPRPWVNVLANPEFGCLVSETGAGTTWSRNSREYRLTPWSNDPVVDPPSEGLYLRDEATGAVWSPQPGPAAGEGPCEARHGIGVSSWRRRNGALTQETTVFVPPDQPLRLIHLRLVNHGEEAMSLGFTWAARLVLGTTPEESSGSVVTEWDDALGAVWATNPLAGDYGGGSTLAALVLPAGAGPVGATGDRAEFLGLGGTMEAPAALREGVRLEGRFGGGLDPLVALQTNLRVPAGGAVEVGIFLGEALDRNRLRACLEELRQPGAVGAALGRTRAWWQEFTQAVQVRTPLPELDVLMNGWLAWQVVSCRLWGRSAFYQSGGAFGFRDQLQDSAALLWWRPELTRSQILLHAAHQFVEGDVLHWWHPPASRGTRTRFSDDLLWLPFITGLYLEATGDERILEEKIGFREARLLTPGEDEAYLPTRPAAETASLYEHLVRALDRSLAVGRYGLPLMGTGDWNDGMNRVGREGKGESVWLGFFLFSLLDRFLPLVAARGEEERWQRYDAARRNLREALDTAGWDGGWYRRAYYDDGTPLGSAESEECRIDLLAQAWAVLSGVASPARVEASLDAVEEHLVDNEAGLLRLLTPAFDKTPHDPGYIRGYVPGVRENGGQYTHAAVWAVQAFAVAGRRERAGELLRRILPVTHGRWREGVETCQVEPYVVAADIYGVAPHVGRGGWTWYTGAAGWLYRVVLETILGVTVEGGTILRIEPRIPDSWPSFEVTWQRQGTLRIRVENPERRAERIVRATLEGVEQPVEVGAVRVPLPTAGEARELHLILGPAELAT